MKEEKRNVLKYMSYGILAIAALLAIYCTSIIYTYSGILMASPFILVVIVILSIALLLSKKKAGIALTIGIVLLIFLTVFSFAGHKVNHMLSKVEAKKEYEVVQIVTLKDSSLTPESDLSSCHISYDNSENGTYKKVGEILKEHKKTINLSIPYKTTEQVYSSLIRNESQMMLLTGMTKAKLETIDPEYKEKIKVLFEKKYEFNHVNLKPVDISKEPFTLYLQGADLSSGDNINSVGRGDANILLTVNPKTKKVNMQIIPRDTFVNIPSMGGRSKLSYSGVWGGVQSSIESIEEEFGIEINYYAKINFQGVVDLVDALGGVDVYSNYNFSSGGYYFTEGYNPVSGKQALAFVRERKSLPKNELSRGKNQMEMVKAIFTKFGENPSYDSGMIVLDTLSNNFVTNVPQKDYMKVFNLVVELLPSLRQMEPHSIEGEYRWHDDEIRSEQYKYYYYPEEGEIERVRQDINDILQGR